MVSLARKICPGLIEPLPQKKGFAPLTVDEPLLFCEKRLFKAIQHFPAIYPVGGNHLKTTSRSAMVIVRLKKL